MLDVINNLLELPDNLDALNRRIRMVPELEIEKCRISRNSPIRYGFAENLDPATFGWDQLSDAVGHVGSLRLVIFVKNRGDNVARIRSIAVSKEPVKGAGPKSSFYVSPEGAESGEPWRFVTNLDDDPPHMREYYLEGGRYIQAPGANYFDCGLIQINPDHVACIVIVMYARDSAYRCSVQLRAESTRLGHYIVVPEHQPDLIVFPLSCVPKEHRYCYNFSSEPPIISSESTLKTYSHDEPDIMF